MLEFINKIYAILKKRRYNREKPFNENEIKERIGTFVEAHSPLHLVGFWGVGPKASSNWADQESCGFLHDLRTQVASVYSPGITFEFVFAQPHAIHNGIPQDSIDVYVLDMQNIFKEYGFQFCDLQKLWDKYEISFEKIEKVLAQKRKDWWQQIPNHTNIEHNGKYRNQKMPARDGAMRYVIMRDLEKKMWEQEYSHAIFHAFSDSKLRGVLPNMPTLYLYARESWSNAPWFVTMDHDSFHRFI